MKPAEPIVVENAAHPDSRFVDVDLARAVFNDVDLRVSVFRNAAMAGATFDNVSLNGVRITNADLEGMTIDGILVTDLLRLHATGV